MGSKKLIHKEKLESQKALEKNLEEAYKELDHFVLNTVIKRKLSLVPLYFDKAMEGNRTYKADFRFLPSTDTDIKEAPEELKKLDQSENKLEII